MKNVLRLLFLISFLTLSLFGMVFVEASMSHANCLVSTLTGSPCPLNGAESVTHHLSAYQILSRATTPLGLSLGVTLFVLIAFVLLREKDIGAQTRLKLSRTRYWHEHGSPPDGNFLFWLALFEHSPSLA